MRVRGNEALDTTTEHQIPMIQSRRVDSRFVVEEEHDTSIHYNDPKQQLASGIRLTSLACKYDPALDKVLDMYYRQKRDTF